jgi:hypothetical protein
MNLLCHKHPNLYNLVLVAMISIAPSAMARVLTMPNSPSAHNEWKGATTGLGSSHRFATEGAAVSHCGTIDPVVWSDGQYLIYYPSESPQYGKTNFGYGFYACKSEADGAGFRQGSN